MPSDENPYHLAAAAAEALRDRTGGDAFEVAIILGSGWSAAIEQLGDPFAEVATEDLPGFHRPTVAGHAGRALAFEVAGHRVLALLGRVHLYEGWSEDQVVHPVRTAAAAGCSTIVLTNAAGGLDPNWGPGQAVLISDHLNLTNRSPLSGPNPPEGFSGRFVDLTDLYSARLRAVAHSVDPSLPEGVYAGLRGPHYETPAEVRMLQGLGASLVGMSTVLEAIAARHLGLEILGCSLVTNLAAGVSPTPLNHAEVLEAGAAAAPGLGQLLRATIAALP